MYAGQYQIFRHEINRESYSFNKAQTGLSLWPVVVAPS